MLRENDFEQLLSQDFLLSSAVAGFGMLLRNSEFKESSDYKIIMDMPKDSKGEDEEGYHSDFLRLV